ncbi:MAG TPA: type II toxin-antitoxin system HicB family antitoxin [Ktedonobacterales bacterium]
MYRYLVIIEQGETSYGAYAPDLPGCVAVGDTREEVERNMREAIAMHPQGMIDDQEPIPPATSTSAYLDVSLPNTVA